MKLSETGRLVLLADSQLLFPGRHSGPLLGQLHRWVAGRRGVYIGASNGDLPEYFEMAVQAFSAVGATLVWQKATDNVPETHADFYVLSGGDVTQGWRYLQHPAVMQALQQACKENAPFIGVSAGAIHLAHGFMGPASRTFLGWLGAAVAVHEERDHWPTLQHWKQSAMTDLPLLTIPMGGALVVSDGQAYQAGKGCSLHVQGNASQALPWLSPSGGP